MRRAVSIVLTDDERAALTALARSRVGAARLVTRARTVLAAAEGTENCAVAARLGVAEGTVRPWRRRFAESRLAGIEPERPGRGRKATKRKHGARTIREITTKRIRRGSFPSVGHLERAINDFIAEHNATPRPFVWTADLKDILPKILRAHEALNTVRNQ